MSPTGPIADFADGAWRDRRHAWRRHRAGAVARDFCDTARRCQQRSGLCYDAGTAARRGGHLGAAESGERAALCRRIGRNRPRSGASAALPRPRCGGCAENGKRGCALSACGHGHRRIVATRARTVSDCQSSSGALCRDFGCDPFDAPRRGRSRTQRGEHALVGRQCPFQSARCQRAGADCIRPHPAAPARACGRRAMARCLGA